MLCRGAYFCGRPLSVGAEVFLPDCAGGLLLRTAAFRRGEVALPDFAGGLTSADGRFPVGAGVFLPDCAGIYSCLRPGSALLTLACLLFRGTLSPSVSPPAKGGNPL